METLLEVKNISKNFDGKSIHKDVSFTLHKGETLALLGGSGTGKSVLLRSIIGLEEIDTGEILYQGKRIDLLPEEELYLIRTKISYAFQNGALFDSINVFENVAYSLFEHTKLDEHEIHQKVMNTLDLVNMKDAELLMPSDLSGGMQKRVGLARSMALEPDIMLYDEPTAGLDPSNVETVLEIMHKFKQKNVSGIFITHDIAAALKICDRFLILKDGIIYFNGNYDDFKNSHDSYVQTFLTGQ